MAQPEALSAEVRVGVHDDGHDRRRDIGWLETRRGVFPGCDGLTKRSESPDGSHAVPL